MIIHVSGEDKRFKASLPIAYLVIKVAIALCANTKVKIVSSKTVTVSERRSATIDPRTLVKEALPTLDI